MKLMITELAVIAREYPRGGARACQLAGIERSIDAIRGIAYRNDLVDESRMVEYQGKKWRIAHLARRQGVGVSLLRKRIKSGWPIERAIQRAKYNRGRRGTAV